MSVIPLQLGLKKKSHKDIAYDKDLIVKYLMFSINHMAG